MSRTRIERCPRSCAHDESDEVGGLLRLLGLGGGHLLLATLRGSLRTGLGIKNVVPPAEARRIVSDEALVVNVVVFGACPERQEMMQAPRELIAGMSINGLEQPADDPEVHGQDVQVVCDGAVQDGRANGTEAEDHDFDGRCVFGSKTEGGGVLVVDLVDVLVEGAPVHGAVHPVVPCVFEDEEDCNLVSHLVHGWEGHRCAETEVLAERVEEPDLGEFDGKVGEEDEEGALPLFPGGRNFLLD